MALEKFLELVILLPCHSLEDFPVYSEGEEAEGLLAAWTALWHPALIHSAQAMPTWCRMDDPPEELGGKLLVIPPVSHMELPTGFAQRAKEAGGCPVRRKLVREEIVDAALDSLQQPAPMNEEFVKDFFALSYAYLQVQILTRQMRYSSNLDEIHFANQVVAAVNAAAAGDGELAEEKLTACFDLLSEERDLFYSVDSFLIDLVMLAPTTLGAGLQRELNASAPVNLLLSAGVLDAMQPRGELCEAVKAAWQEGRIGLLACDEGEASLPLLPLEAVARKVQQGRDRVEQVLGRRPAVYGRRRYGLTPCLPQLLRKLGMTAALHATLEEGRFPESSQVKTRWEGGDRAAVDALAKAPLNASLAETFLGLALKTGETMDADHVATLVLAHWPGKASPYLEDLRRASRRTAALGKFVEIEAYFADTDEPNDTDRFSPSRCRSPYLRQAIVRRHANPLSHWVRYHQRRAALESAHTLQALASFTDGRPRDGHEQSLERLDAACETAAGTAADDEAIDHEEALRNAAEQAVEALKLTPAPESDGVLVLNPHAFVRRLCVELPQWKRPPDVQRPVYAAAVVGDRALAVVDVPPMGYVHLTPGQPARRREPPLVTGAMLRNEFMEVTINERTGGIASVLSYDARGNRMSQQVAMRIPSDTGQRAVYSTMTADAVETIESNVIRGAIRSRGRLADDDGNLLAEFTQTVTLSRGSRVFDIEIQLRLPDESCLRSDPWNSYFASRFAWKDEASTVACDVNQIRHGMADRRRLEALRYIELDNGANTTTIFPRGLPYHRRIGLSALDTLLVVRGESARRFQLSVGVDVAYPLQEAEGLWSEPLLAGSSAPSPDSAWLCQLGARNATVTHWTPRVDGGRVGGFQARLLETSGRPAQVKLQSLRPLHAARIVDLDGATLSECRVEDGAANVALAPREWVIVEAQWES